MSIKRRVVWLGGLTFLATFILIMSVLQWPGGQRPRLRVENYPRIRKGISRATIEKLLGGPAGDYGRFADGTVIQSAEGFRASGARSIWRDDHAKIEIYFDPNEKVVAYHKRAFYRRTRPSGFISRVFELGGKVRRYVTGEPAPPPVLRLKPEM